MFKDSKLCSIPREIANRIYDTIAFEEYTITIERDTFFITKKVRSKVKNKLYYFASSLEIIRKITGKRPTILIPQTYQPSIKEGDRLISPLVTYFTTKYIDPFNLLDEDNL